MRVDSISLGASIVSACAVPVAYSPLWVSKSNRFFRIHPCKNSGSVSLNLSDLQNDRPPRPRIEDQDGVKTAATVSSRANVKTKKGEAKDQMICDSFQKKAPLQGS